MDDEQMTKKKPKSEVRKKGKIIGVRVSEVELAEIQIKAETAGLSIASFIRETVLKKPITESKKKPSLDKVILSQLLGQLGKVGSNINQIARRLNEGGSVGAERITGACDDFWILRDELIKAIKGGADDNKRKE